eukprot:jgi/Ulvmu1/4645/UM002_0376.1
MALQNAAFAGDAAKALSALHAGFPVNDARATEFANACSTGLHVAAENGHFNVVSLLLRSGADPVLVDGWGHTAAHLAAMEDHADILQMIIDKDPRVLDILDDQDRTPLHAAAHAGSKDSVRVLLANGAKVQRLTTELEGDVVALGSAIHTASAAGHTDCLRLLIPAADADAINGGDCFDRSPLHMAAAAGHSDCVRVLVVAGASVNGQNSWGASSLHLAARGQSPAAVDTLLECGADANGVDHHHLTPLHYAAQATCLPAMRMLLEAEADINAETGLGATALKIVASQDAVDAVAMLLPTGAALDTLQACWHDLGASSRAAVQQYVREVCLVAACSMRGVTTCTGEDILAVSALPMDMTHCILANVLGTGEHFVRLLLDGRLEGCV